MYRLLQLRKNVYIYIKAKTPKYLLLSLDVRITSNLMFFSIFYTFSQLEHNSFIVKEKPNKYEAQKLRVRLFLNLKSILLYMDSKQNKRLHAICKH